MVLEFKTGQKDHLNALLLTGVLSIYEVSTFHGRIQTLAKESADNGTIVE